MFRYSIVLVVILFSFLKSRMHLFERLSDIWVYSTNYYLLKARVQKWFRMLNFLQREILLCLKNGACDVGLASPIKAIRGGLFIILKKKMQANKFKRYTINILMSI